ncbi:hypothetical protein FH972_022622 [Carpinus fangiana]|uniref:Uncharacterized protein n=1 Tax=Carpinus fangiana TaxID=176857 RepID=A0A5N6KSR7_9ROSI|nr:hypothetical protein FH972_022622 [Carpinus fangiana]
MPCPDAEAEQEQATGAMCIQGVLASGLASRLRHTQRPRAPSLPPASVACRPSPLQRRAAAGQAADGVQHLREIAILFSPWAADAAAGYC